MSSEVKNSHFSYSSWNLSILLFRWYPGDWSPCSVSCGGGSRFRQIHCVEETNNTRTKVTLQAQHKQVVFAVIKVSRYVSRLQGSKNSVCCLRGNKLARHRFRSVQSETASRKESEVAVCAPPGKLTNKMIELKTFVTCASVYFTLSCSRWMSSNVTVGNRGSRNLATRWSVRNGTLRDGPGWVLPRTHYNCN